MHGKRAVAVVGLVVIAITGCSSANPVPESRPTVAATIPIGWPIRTAEWVDLWLHGYALISGDTAQVPFFDRGYRSRMLAVRRQRNVTTALDANQQTLSAGFTRNPGLVNGGFVVFAFQSWAELKRVGQLFVQNDGSPTTVNDPVTQQLFVQLRTYYPTVADREWLRLFILAMDDEQTKFYNSYWTAVQSDRAATRMEVDRLWTGTYRNKFSTLLRRIRLVDGAFILSLPLGGEGRTILDSQLGNGAAIGFPSTPDSALNAIYAFTHEIAGSTVVDLPLRENTTVAEQRNGVIERLAPVAAVRAGSLVLQRIAPELVEGYQRYYLRVSGAAVPTTEPNTSFVRAFTIPDVVRDAIAKQIDAILAGI